MRFSIIPLGCLALSAISSVAANPVQRRTGVSRTGHLGPQWQLNLADLAGLLHSLQPPLQHGRPRTVDLGTYQHDPSPGRSAMVLC